MRHLAQAGDTIIEVLIAMAIISLVLAGAFLTTRNSQNAVLNSQEHAAGLQLIESQIEQLRSVASADSQSPVFTTSKFCMYQGSQINWTAPNTPAAQCVQDNSGSQPPAGSTAVTYTLSIKGCISTGHCGNPIANSYLYTIVAQWYGAGASGKAQEQMVYRLYQ
ncbi:MAG TPA: type II secretion system protein [Candidatus Saccharimonadales bacterium]|jgi:prepilin-type N-terminal cleavage/methylation domain-containing protein